MAVSGADIVNEARRFLGDPYVWGGAGPSGFDCSGLVQYSLKRLGIQSPRTSEDIWAWTQHIPASQVQPGDLVFFRAPGGGPPPGHVGIVVTPGTATHAGTMVDAPTVGESVSIQTFEPNATGDMQVVGYGRPRGVTGSPVQLTSDVQTTGVFGSILQVPGQIITAFADADRLLGEAEQWFLAMTKPSTYVRWAVGLVATLALIFGLSFMVKAGGAA